MVHDKGLRLLQLMGLCFEQDAAKGVVEDGGVRDEHPQYLDHFQPSAM